MKTNKKEKVFEECGCCGCFHRQEYAGDCRNDNERYNYEDIPLGSIVYERGQQIIKR